MEERKHLDVKSVIFNSFSFWYDPKIRELAIIDDPDIENRVEDEKEANELLDEIFLFPKFLIQRKYNEDNGTTFDVKINNDHQLLKTRLQNEDMCTIELTDLWKVHTLCKEDIYVNAIILALGMILSTESANLYWGDEKITKISAVVTNFKKNSKYKVRLFSEKTNDYVDSLQLDGGGEYFMLFLKTEKKQSYYIDMCPFNHPFIETKFNKWGYPLPHLWDVYQTKDEIPFDPVTYIPMTHIMSSFQSDIKHLEGLEDETKTNSEHSDQFASVTLLHCLAESVFHKFSDKIDSK